VFEESVGGGISQFATTLFNAAFFGGLEYGAYQSHSIYIERYPYGREATLSYPEPDLVIENPSPYGVLIWPTYTASSITVTLYSTPWATGAPTAQTESQVGACTRVTTERTRTFRDGRTVKDRVLATYRPAEGVTC
jgi:vancomycin resistance protein YoaR